MDKGEDFRSLVIKSTGAKVANRRKQHSHLKSQSELAASIGVSRAAISALEAGRQGVSLETLCRIALTLGVSPSRLLPDRDELEELERVSRGRRGSISPEDVVDRFIEEGPDG